MSEEEAKLKVKKIETHFIKVLETKKLSDIPELPSNHLSRLTDQRKGISIGLLAKETELLREIEG